MRIRGLLAATATLTLCATTLLCAPSYAKTPEDEKQESTTAPARKPGPKKSPEDEPSRPGAPSLEVQLRGVADKNLRQCLTEHLVAPPASSEKPARLSELTALACGSRNIATLDGLEAAQSLRDLDVSANPGLKNLGKIAVAPALKTLDVSGTGLKITAAGTLPEGLTLLSANGIQGTSISALPPGLQSLNLRQSGLDSLAGIEKLKGLRHLDVAGNALTELEALSKLHHLESLDASKNQIVSAQPLRALTSLRDVDLCDNRIGAPEDLGKIGGGNPRVIADGQQLRGQALYVPANTAIYRYQPKLPQGTKAASAGANSAVPTASQPGKSGPAPRVTWKTRGGKQLQLKFATPGKKARYSGSITYPVKTARYTSLQPGSATVGKNYGYYFRITPGFPLAKPGFTVVSGQLPAGLTLSGNGLLSGTPTVADVSWFTVAATDIYGNQIRKEFTLAVNQAGSVAASPESEAPTRTEHVTTATNHTAATPGTGEAKTLLTKKGPFGTRLTIAATALLMLLAAGLLYIAYRKRNH